MALSRLTRSWSKPPRAQGSAAKSREVTTQIEQRLHRQRRLRSHPGRLDSVRATLPSADPYTYFDNAGASEFVGTAPTFGQPVSQTGARRDGQVWNRACAPPPSSRSTPMHREPGSRRTVPPSTRRGDTIAAVGMDYLLDYVAEVQRQARAEVLPSSSSVTCSPCCLVLTVSTLIVRPLRRLTAATNPYRRWRVTTPDLSRLTRSGSPMRCPNWPIRSRS